MTLDLAISVADQRTEGKARRSVVGRSAHAELHLPADRDPVGIIEAQHPSRLADLVPVRVGRMLQSPFAHYRGTAAVMAADLAAAPTPDIRVVACGDAHISNFGLFASPERSLVFDLNDFDEAGVAPWEWDLKRLVASVHIGGRDMGLDEDRCVTATTLAAIAYRETLAELMAMTALERYYFRVAVSDDMVARSGKRVRKAVDKARRRTSQQVLSKFTHVDTDGRRRIVDQPPLTRHVDDPSLDTVGVAFERYRHSVRGDVELLLNQFRLVDHVLRVVGVGSVGTRCYLVMLEGPGGESLFLQVKEAQPSVLHTHGGMPSVLGITTRLTNNGTRVVAAQRILQAQSDPFLGWITDRQGVEDGPGTDYYWRQFRDMKGSVDLGTLTPSLFLAYAQLCARLLARAHAQSPGAGRIVGYLGGSERFDTAVATWARAYADLAERDFAALEAAVASGRLPAERGI